MISETPNLAAKIASVREKRLGWWPDSQKGLIMRCWARKCSPRQVLKAFCLECVGGDRDAIRTCTGYACPIWEYRPFQTKSVQKQDKV